MIDLVRSFLGEVEEVQGFATSRVWKYGDAEDNGFLLMRSPQGCIATLHASWTEWGRYQFRIELVGPLGKIVATCFPMRTEITWSDTIGGRTRTQTNRFIGTMIGEHAKSYRWVVAQSFAREYDAFARAIAGQPSTIASGFDGMRAIEIASSATHLPDASSEARTAMAGRGQ
jgi:predicted dehydrogenase